MTGKTPMAHTLAYLMLTITVLLWAVGVVIARAVREEIPMIGLSFWRWFAAGLILLPVVGGELARKKEVIRRSIRLLIAQGILIVGSGALLFYALNFTTVINATLVNATQPALTIGLAHFLLGDKLRPVQLAGILCAILGVGVMVTQADLKSLMTMGLNPGDLLVILAIIGYAFYAVNLRRMPRDLGTFAALAVILLSGSLFLLPFYLAETILVRPVPFTLLTVEVVVLLTVVVSIMAMGMWNHANHVVGPSRAAVFVNLLPVYGAILAILFLDERLYPYHFLGTALVCSGIFLVVRK